MKGDLGRWMAGRDAALRSGPAEVSTRGVPGRPGIPPREDTPAVDLADDHDRAMGVSSAIGAHRPQEQLVDPAVPA
jgi:hypothetical protein